MGPDINYPEQPSYGEGLSEAMLAQRQLISGEGDFEGLGLLDPRMIELERQYRNTFGDMEVDSTIRTLLGEGARADDQGRISTGEGKIVTGEDGGTLKQSTDNNGVSTITYTSPDGTESSVRTDEPDYKRKFEQLKTDVPGFAGLKDQLSDTPLETLYEGGYDPGAIVQRGKGGLLDVYGGNTKVRQVDQETGEVTYGTAGFTPEGEFKGLIPMQQEAEAYLASQQRESDISDVEKLGTRATDAIRDQGDIRGALSDLEKFQNQNQAQVGVGRQMLLGEAIRNIGEGLSAREQRDLEQASRAAGTATGRARDIGRIAGEAAAVTEGNRQRRQENLATAQSLLGSEMGMRSQDFGMGLQRLGAEQSTAADPMMAILGRPSSAAPNAQGLLSQGAGMQQGAGPNFFNPEAGLGYISQQNANQATMAAGQAAGRGSMIGGLLSGGANIATRTFMPVV